MAKRKYTRLGENPQGLECTNKKCKWQGLECEIVPKALEPSITEDSCPECGNTEFYGLIEKPHKPENVAL